MASNILGSDPGRTGYAIGRGIENAKERGETPTPIGFSAGSPGKFADPRYGSQRYAGDIFQGKGMEGEFAMAIANKKNKPVQDGMEKFVHEWTSGPWSPFDMGPEEEIPQGETA